MKSKAKFFRFAYYQPPDNRDKVRLHELRDGSAFLEMSSVLVKQGLEYGGTILNHPDPNCANPNIQFEESDILVLTTRPPLNDGEKSYRPVRSSGTELEKAVFTVLRRYFEYCARDKVGLSSDMAGHLKDEEAKNKAVFEFRVNESSRVKSRAVYTGHGHYEKYGDFEYVENGDKTIVYLLYTRETWIEEKSKRPGPQLIVSFGMGGPENLIWSYLLRTKYSNFLDNPIFFMGEMEVKDTIIDCHSSLEFAKHWEVKTILECEPKTRLR